MDDAALKKIRETAEQNGINPDELIAAVKTADIPPELQEAITTIMGDLTTFSEALDKLDK